MNRLGTRVALSAAAIAPLLLVTAPARAARIGDSRPFVVIGTIIENRGDGVELVIGDITDATPNMQRRAAANGTVTLNVASAEVRDDTYYWEAGFMDCSSESRVVVCAEGAQVDVLGHIEDQGPLGDKAVADVVRPMSGLGVTRSTSATVAVSNNRDRACGEFEENCSRLEGFVVGGEFAGWSARLDYSCVNGYRATWRISRYGYSLSGEAREFFDPFVFGALEGPEQRGGGVLGGTGKFAGATGVASIPPLTRPCGFSPQFTIYIELA